MNGQDGMFDSLALFNTIIGLMNIDKNNAQHIEQRIMNQKLDLILAKLESLERGEQS